MAKQAFQVGDRWRWKGAVAGFEETLVIVGITEGGVGPQYVCRIERTGGGGWGGSREGVTLKMIAAALAYSVVEKVGTDPAAAARWQATGGAAGGGTGAGAIVAPDVATGLQAAARQAAPAAGVTDKTDHVVSAAPPMTVAALRKTLEPWFARHARPAWLPKTAARNDAGAGLSKFGGTPWLAPGEPWPACTACGRPMPLFLQLDLGTLPAEAGARWGTGLLQLFYCTGGADGHCPAVGYAPFSDGQLARVVHPSGPGGTATHGQPAMAERPIVGWTPIDDVPGSEEQEEMGLRCTFDGDRHTARYECPEIKLVADGLPDTTPEQLPGPSPKDKLGGWPFWVQGMKYPNCPTCGTRMELVFQLASNEHVDFMFGDMGVGHVTQCPKHREVVAFGWAGT
jgi:hypothetical protein